MHSSSSYFSLISQRPSQTRAFARLLLITAVLLFAACGDANDTRPGDPTLEQINFNLSLSMNQFMEDLLEPVADSLWRSAGWIEDEVEGYFELYPTTDEGWRAVYQSAAIIVEAGNMLMLPGRAEDVAAWQTYAQAMSNVGLQLMNAAQEQHEEDLFQAGARLYSVCTACHQAYNTEMSRFAN